MSKDKDLVMYVAVYENVDLAKAFPAILDQMRHRRRRELRQRSDLQGRADPRASGRALRSCERTHRSCRNGKL